MTYLSYIIKAKNQYNIHSPYLFGLYCDVINSTIDNHHIGVERPSKTDKIIYKFANTFKPSTVYINPSIDDKIHKIISQATKHCHTSITHTFSPSLIDMAIITSINEWQNIKNMIHTQSIVIWLMPHTNQHTEQEFETFKADGKIKVCIDMYKIGIALFLTQLHKENYLLK